MCTRRLPGLVSTSEYIQKHDLVLLCVLETVIPVVYAVIKEKCLPSK